MPKTALSVTLEPENLLWLRGRARALHTRSLSAALDAVLREARRSAGPIRSVVGTIDLPHGERSLLEGDAEIRRAFERSLRRGSSPRKTRRG